MSSPRTILFLHPSAELYGADRTLLQLVQGLDPKEWRAVVAIPRRGSLAEPLEAAGALVETCELGLGQRSSLRLRGLLKLCIDVPIGAFQVWRLARRYQPSVIHTNTMIVLGGAIGARLSGKPHLWHVHEILQSPTWLARVYAKLFCLLAEQVISNSEATRESFNRWCTHLAKKHAVVLNGVDAVECGVAENRSAFRKKLGLKKDQPLVLLAGRINSWKGQGLLIQTAKKLHSTWPEARYLLAGSAPEGQARFEHAIEEQISEAGLAEVVLRIPFQSDSKVLYEAADVCCVPSTRPEPFGLVALEAMRASKPVIASDHGGLPEIVQHGFTGYLFDPGNPEELENYLGRVFFDPEHAGEMGARGRERQQTNFSVERYCGEFAQLYERVAEDSRPDELPAETRVIHLSLGKLNPNRLNGVNRAVHGLAQAQVTAGRTVEVWGLTPTPNAPAGARPYKLRLFKRSPIRGWLPIELRRAIRELEQPAVVHLHGGLLPEMASAARHLKRAGIPLVFTPHGAYNPKALAKRPWLKRICMALVDRAILRRVRRVQAFTTAESHAIARWTPLEQIAVVPNGQSPGAERSIKRSHADPMRFGFCGRLDAHTKGLDLMLDGFARFLAEGGSGHLLLIGDGPDREALQARASQADLHGNIEFAGALFDEAKLERLETLDAFVHPSRHEGMPMSVLEAGSLGLPLLVSEGTQLESIVQACEAGPLLPSTDAEGIAKTLHELANAPEEDLLNWGRQARRMVNDSYSWEQVEPLAAHSLYGITRETAVDVSSSSAQRKALHPPVPLTTS